MPLTCNWLHCKMVLVSALHLCCGYLGSLMSSAIGFDCLYFVVVTCLDAAWSIATNFIWFCSRSYVLVFLQHFMACLNVVLTCFVIGIDCGRLGE